MSVLFTLELSEPSTGPANVVSAKKILVEWEIKKKMRDRG